MNQSVEEEKKPRFQIKKWIPVALWSWDIQVDTCAICKNHIMEKCIECEANDKSPQGECKALWGICNHAYHNHCIERWLKNKNTCPLDNSIWEPVSKDTLKPIQQ